MIDRPTTLTFLIDPVQSMIFVDILDLSRPRAVLEDVVRICRHANYNRTYDVLVDCSRLDVVPNVGVISTYARLFREAACEHEGAIAISGNSDAGYGMARTFEVLSNADLKRMCAFPSVETARAWLITANATGSRELTTA